MFQKRPPPELLSNAVMSNVICNDDKKLAREVAAIPVFNVK